MEDFNDLALFAHVVEQQGFSAASRHLGIPKSRLSRRVSQLEERIGVRLLQRSSRRLLLTSVGRQFYERCQATVAAGEEAFDVARQATAQPQGLLRVSCPFTLAQFWLTPLIPSFMRAFPGVRLQLEVSNRRVDPLQENIDVVLRVRRPPFEDSSLVARPLGSTVDVLLASPALVERLGMPRSLGDLAAWPVLSLPADNERYRWALERGSESHDFAFTPHVVTDDMFALRHLAEQGMGLALLPRSCAATPLPTAAWCACAANGPARPARSRPPSHRAAACCRRCAPSSTTCCKTRRVLRTRRPAYPDRPS